MATSTRVQRISRLLYLAVFVCAQAALTIHSHPAAPIGAQDPSWSDAVLAAACRVCDLVQANSSLAGRAADCFRAPAPSGTIGVFVPREVPAAFAALSAARAPPVS
jgi:hypothetical protein